MFCALKAIQWHSFLWYQKRRFRAASINEEFAEIIMINTKETILKEINILFIVYFCLGKYSFSLNTFWTHPTCNKLDQNVILTLFCLFNAWVCFCKQLNGFVNNLHFKKLFQIQIICHELYGFKWTWELWRWRSDSTQLKAPKLEHYPDS